MHFCIASVGKPHKLRGSSSGSGFIFFGWHNETRCAVDRPLAITFPNTIYPHQYYLSD